MGGSFGCRDGGYSGYLGVLLRKLYCVGVAIVPDVGHIDAITKIMVHFWAEVTPIYAVGYPRCVFVGGFVYHDLRAWWR